MINTSDFTELPNATKATPRTYGKPRINFRTSSTGRVRMTLATATRDHMINSDHAADEFPDLIDINVLSNPRKQELLIVKTNTPDENTFVLKRNNTNQYGASFIPNFEIPDGTLDVELTEVEGAPAALLSLPKALAESAEAEDEEEIYDPEIILDDM